jgi:hypothetical protein
MPVKKAASMRPAEITLHEHKRALEAKNDDTALSLMGPLLL